MEDARQSNKGSNFLESGILLARADESVHSQDQADPGHDKTAEHGSGDGGVHDLTTTFYGVLAVILFVLCYSLVPLENNIHLRKSKPVLFAAGIIWILVSIAYARIGDTHTPHEAIKHSLLEYAELFLFLLAAMTYINAMEERNIFQRLRAYLVSKGFSLRMVFWVTGMLAFVISPIADNLTTALLMGAVVMAVGGTNKKFVALACVNVVVAANAGGAFSPFGDITTLMVWQKGKVTFTQFFAIFIPSVVNWLVPAIVMNFFVPKEAPQVLEEEIEVTPGGYVMIGLFLLTIVTAVSFHNFLHLPPAAGMMLGLGLLGLFSYYIKMRAGHEEAYPTMLGVRDEKSFHPLYAVQHRVKTLSKTLETLPIAAFAINQDHEVTHWNRACEKLTGIPAREIVGTKKQWSAFYDQERPIMADLILESAPESEYEKYYAGKRQESAVEFATEGTDFFPHMGEKGTWLSFAAAPITDDEGTVVGAVTTLQDMTDHDKAVSHFDIMQRVARAEWDTLLFFYGVILCVGGLGQFGYLALISQLMYADFGPTIANSMVGVLSAILDNIPVMFAVLSMDPDMSLGQWQLVTLTAGVGGSMLAIGSAAGVALMGTARGVYTFGAHLKWTPVIAAGYVASIFVHLILNARLM
jgi:PAS domain S-box-containing protein